MDGPKPNITKRKARNKQCVFPDERSFPSGDYPCFPNNEDSMCCRAGDACMSNGLCRAPGDMSQNRIRYTRGSCTDCRTPVFLFFFFVFADVFRAVKGIVALVHAYALIIVRVP